MSTPSTPGNWPCTRNLSFRPAFLSILHLHEHESYHLQLQVIARVLS